MKPARILVAGNCTVDWVCDPIAQPVGRNESVRVDAIEKRLGGCAANTARVLRGFGFDVTLVSRVGPDAEAEFVRSELQEHGLEIELPSSRRPTGVSFCFRGESGWRSFVSAQGANLDLDVEDVDAFLSEEFTALVLTGFLNQTNTALESRLIDCLNRVRAKGCLIALGVTGSTAPLVTPELLARVDLLAANEREAEGLDLEAPRVSVTTRGADGAVLRSARFDVDIPGFEVDAIDSIGAGDAFLAGWVCAATEGFDPKDRARNERQVTWAAACGALACTTRGGGVPVSREQVDALLATRR